MRQKHSVLVIGLDAMERDLVNDWVVSEDLPVLAKMRADGMWSEVEPAPGMGSDANWMSFITGRPPGQHGRYFYRQLREGTYKADVTDPTLVHNLPPFWHHLSDEDRRVIAIDMPYGQLPDKIHGIQVTDWLCHDRIYPQVGTCPAEFKKSLDRYGSDTLGASDAHGRKEADFVSLTAELTKRVANKERLALDLMRKEKWDFFAVTFTDAHDGGHVMWHLHDPSHPEHDAGYVSKHGDPLKKIYQAVDQAVGRLSEAAGPETNVVLFSCVGMGPNYSCNHFLDVFLRRREFGANPPKRFVDPLRKAYVTLMPSAVRNKLLGVAAQAKEELQAKDRAERAYFAIPHNEISGAIRINLKGRDPRGKVAAGGEYRRLIDDLQRDLYALTNADTGRHVVESVIRTTDVFHGCYVDRLPDLLVKWTGEEPVWRLKSECAGIIEMRNSGSRTGDHTSHIWMAAQGPNIHPGQLNNSIRVTDFAPTLGELCGVLPHAEWKGKTINALTVPEDLKPERLC